MEASTGMPETSLSAIGESDAVFLFGDGSMN
jgi:hypothetical protein